MYYTLKTATLKDGKIYLTVADSTLTPQRFFRTVYKGSLNSFFIDIWRGEIMPRASAKLKGVSLYDIRVAMDKLRGYAPTIDIFKDKVFGVHFDDELSAILAKKSEKWLTNRSILLSDGDFEEIRKLEEGAKMVYAEKKAVQDAKHLIRISAAAQSDLFKGYNVFECYDDERVFLGRPENYHRESDYGANLYDNSGQSVIFTEGKGARLFNLLSASPAHLLKN